MRTLVCFSLVIITFTFITYTSSHPMGPKKTPLKQALLIRNKRDKRRGYDGQSRYSGQGSSGQGSSGPVPARQGSSGPGPSGQGTSEPGPSGQGHSGQWSSGPPSPGPEFDNQDKGRGEDNLHQDSSNNGMKEDSEEWFENWWSMIDHGSNYDGQEDLWASGNGYGSHEDSGSYEDYGQYGENYWSGYDEGSATESEQTGETGPSWYSGGSGIHWADDDTGDYLNSDPDSSVGINSEPTTTQGMAIAEQLRRSRGPEDVLDGPPGSVCSRQVLEAEFHDETVGYPCWEMERVSCWDCGRNCRRRRDKCYRLTRSTCYRQERRCRKVLQDKYYCCPGYQQQGNTCVREAQNGGCEVQNGGCEHFCESDVYGNHWCQCFNGYRLVDGTRCEDIDECEGYNGFCNQGCENTEGSYYCTCLDGYRLQDHLTCAEIDECSTSNGGCAHQCFNTHGAFYCECDAGFTRRNGFQCEDVDECETAGHCSHRCDNLPGGYLCSCPTEMRLSAADNKTCIGMGVSADPDQEPAGGGEVDSQVGIAVIAGGAGGGVVLICLIVLLVYILYRTRNTDSANRTGTRTSGGRSSRTGEEYQSGPHVPKGGATSDPVQFDNHGYERVDLPPPPKVVPPPGVIGGPYLEPIAPPSYMEATAPPAPPEVHSYMALTRHGDNIHAKAHPPSEAPSYLTLGYGDTQATAPAIYEPMDYGAIGSGYADRDVRRYDNRTPSPPLLPPRPSQMVDHDKTPSPPKVMNRPQEGKDQAPDQAASASTKPKAEASAAMGQIDNNQLANAMKNLKKVKK